MRLSSWLSSKESTCQAGDTGLRVQYLGWEDPLEEGMTTHSSILAGEIPRTEESGRLRTMGLQRVGQDLTVELTV